MLKKIVAIFMMCGFLVASMPLDSANADTSNLDACQEAAATLTCDSVNGDPVQVEVKKIPTTSMTMFTNGEYAEEYLIDITPQDLRAAAGEYSDTVYDPSGGVKLWARITFDRSGSAVRVTQIRGNCRVLDGSLYVFNRQVIAATSTMYFTIQRKVWHPTTDAFSYNTGFKKYVDPEQPGASVGGNYQVDIQRKGGGKIWNCMVSLALNNPMPTP